jgi:hypothetical protein
VDQVNPGTVFFFFKYGEEKVLFLKRWRRKLQLTCYVPDYLWKKDRPRVGWLNGSTRAEDAQGTPTQSDASPSVLV